MLLGVLHLQGSLGRHRVHCPGLEVGVFLLALTHRQSVYTQETAKSTHLSASAVEQWSEAADGADSPSEEAWEDRSAIQMIGPSTRNRKDVL